tara:strand:- start:2285 stop:2974 length:690 start_codon:yes stop_codon:yes gene_type:complete
VYNFGSHKIDIDLEYHKKQFDNIISQSKAKITGTKGHNLFYPVSKDDKSYLQNYMNELTGVYNDWNFDYFQSGEPAGLHTDYDTVPWDDETECHVVVGCIIPLEWNCKQPYTVNYDKVSDTPRKMMYRKGEMRYKDTDEIFEYRTEWKHNEESLKYNHIDCAYAKEYVDLDIHSVYEWKINTLMLFDTARWHSSSWFLSANNIPDVSTENKRSIIGFGSIDVQRNQPHT